MNPTRRLLTLALAPALGVSLASCRDYAPLASHCASARGDADCIDKYGGSRSFCARGPCTPAKDGCLATRPEDDACYSPCGDGTSLETNPSCMGAADGTTTAGTSADTTTSDSGTTSGQMCAELLGEESP